MKNQTFAAWIENKYREWRATQGRRAGLAQFAKHLNVSLNTLNNWMLRGSLPEGENLVRLASVFGPDEVYAVTEAEPPSEEIHEILALYHHLPPEKRGAVLKFIRKVAGIPMLAKPTEREKSEKP